MARLKSKITWSWNSKNDEMW